LLYCLFYRYLITAPKLWRVDAMETVLVHLIGYEQETTVKLNLKSSLALCAKTYASESVILNAQNQFQASTTLRIYPKDIRKEQTEVYLEAVSSSFSTSQTIPVTRQNGFLFIQTDKPLYTPEQKVEVRVYSLNAQLRKSSRAVSLTFIDPEGTKMEVIEVADINGVKPLLPPFKIPLKPIFGVWKIEAAYTNDFSTTATAEFEIKEYVLPSISVRIQPEDNYVSFALDLQAMLPSNLLSGGISQEAILSNVKFANAPFTLSLIATPPFIKPTLPYSIRVSHVCTPLIKCTLTKHSCKSQAQLQLKTEVYQSVNQRFLYIDLPSELSSFEVDSYANIKIYFSYRDYLPLKTFNYQIVSKGKVVKFATVQRVSEKSQNINFKVTADMVPSARLLVYYILSGEQRAELVADSVWLDIKAKCVNSLDVNLAATDKAYKPKEKLQLSVKTKSDSLSSLVALSAVDMALYNLRSNDKDPMNKVLRHFEHSDLGCGGGGGRNNIDVFHRAGLTFLTNANVIAEVEFLEDVAPVQVRSYFPESWLWEEHAVSRLFAGICVADPVQVRVTQALSVDVPLPYSMVRGEQIELKGSVYNQNDIDTTVSFPIPEGIRKETWIGGRIDPQGVYGKNFNVMSISDRKRAKKHLSFYSELLGELLSIITDPKGIMKLLTLPRGSAEVELLSLLPVFYVYDYLERAEEWGHVGDISIAGLKRKMEEGIISIMSFKSKREHSFTLFRNKEASTWLTALMVKTLAKVDKYLPVDGDMLSNTVRWLITQCQNQNGSFSEKSSYKPNKLMIYQDAVDKAERYLTLHAVKVKNLYVRALATYALNVIDQSSQGAVNMYEKLKKDSQVKGNPVLIRFWQEKDASQDPLKPNKATAATVETTAYALLSCLLRGDMNYAQPVVNWLTQDQRYGGGFHSTQDAILTLEALTQYRTVARQALLNMEVDVSYRKAGLIGRFSLSQNRPIGKPMEVKFLHCFSPHRYRKPENEVEMEAGHTVMEINLPTGFTLVVQDLERLRDGLESRISDFEINGGQVILQMDSIPSDEFYCVGFRIQEVFTTGMNSASTFKVYEFHDPDNQCTKFYHLQTRKLLRLCNGANCQCMAGKISDYAPKRKSTIKELMECNKTFLCGCNDSSVYIRIGTEVGLVKKATCSTNLEIGKHYLIMGAEIMQLRLLRSYRYKFPLDSQASVEWWPSESDCSESSCRTYLNILIEFEFDFSFTGCKRA
uniref:NTR domain-containing protein n=1 Tax=Astyanax mexicanus TaxID=7994 RepID=A0A8B9H1S1_ASTMX